MLVAPVRTISQSPCTTVTTGKLPTVRAVQRDCRWPLKKDGLLHRSRESTIHFNRGSSKLYLDQPFSDGWSQSIIRHVSYPTDSPTATRLGLCSSPWLVYLGRFSASFRVCGRATPFVSGNNRTSRALNKLLRPKMPGANSGLFLA